MVDNVKESLSALIDGEISEIEIHRLLRDAPLDTPLKASWVRFQHVRAVARGESGLSIERHLALHSRISEAISMESALAEGPAVLPRATRMPYLKPAAGLALAASLVVAVFVGVNQSVPGASSGGDVLAVENVIDNATLVASQGVSQGSTPGTMGATLVAGPPAATEMDLRELDDEQLKAVRAYLNQHDRAVRMNPNMRTVIFEDPKGSGK